MKSTQTAFQYQLRFPDQGYSIKGRFVSISWLDWLWITVRFSTMQSCKVSVHPISNVLSSFIIRPLLGSHAKYLTIDLIAFCVWYFWRCCKLCYLTDCECYVWSGIVWHILWQHSHNTCITPIRFSSGSDPNATWVVGVQLGLQSVLILVVSIIFVINPFCDIWPVLSSCSSIPISRYLVKSPSISKSNPLVVVLQQKSSTFFLVGAAIPVSSTYNAINKPG